MAGLQSCATHCAGPTEQTVNSAVAAVVIDKKSSNSFSLHCLSDSEESREWRVGCSYSLVIPWLAADGGNCRNVYLTSLPILLLPSTPLISFVCSTFRIGKRHSRTYIHTHTHSDTHSLPIYIDLSIISEGK